MVEFWVWFIGFLIVFSFFAFAFDDYSWKIRIKFFLLVSFLLAVLIAGASN